MGASAFALLIAAEAGFAEALGTGAGVWARGLATPAGAIGLGAQIAFALFPLLRKTSH